MTKEVNRPKTPNGDIWELHPETNHLTDEQRIQAKTYTGLLPERAYDQYVQTYTTQDVYKTIAISNNSVYNPQYQTWAIIEIFEPPLTLQEFLDTYYTTQEVKEQAELETDRGTIKYRREHNGQILPEEEPMKQMEIPIYI